MVADEAVLEGGSSRPHCEQCLPGWTCLPQKGQVIMDGLRGRYRDGEQYRSPWGIGERRAARRFLPIWKTQGRSPSGRNSSLTLVCCTSADASENHGFGGVLPSG